MSAPFVPGTAHVRVPATSANLGPGFDALGLALGLHDELAARVIDEGLEIDVAGEGHDLGRDETHLVVRAMRRCFAELGVQPPGLALECRNTIPHGRGLGSSAAAIVAGVLLARALVPDGEARLPIPAVLALAAAVEGHPDNVAPCLLGGLTVAWNDAGRARAVRMDPDPAVVPVVLIPSVRASTVVARGLLPDTVPHADAAFAAGRSALLVAALLGHGEALLDATEDRLHQPFRAPAMPESAALVATLRAAGHAAVISGAGPSVLVLARDTTRAESVAGQAPAGWTARIPGVDTAGAVVHVATGS